MAGRERRARKRLTKFDKEGTMVGTAEQVNGFSTGFLRGLYSTCTGLVQHLYRACTGLVHCSYRACTGLVQGVAQEAIAFCLSSRLYIDDWSTIARCALYDLFVDRWTLRRRVAVAEIHRQRRSSVVRTQRDPRDIECESRSSRDQRFRKRFYRG